MPQHSVLSLTLCAVLFALCAPASAQQSKKIPRIGFLSADSAPSIAVRSEAFRQGLRELGYIEGKSIMIESRYADGKLNALKDLADQLVSLHADIIVTTGPSSTSAAKAATTNIAIVMAQDADPVGSGFVTSLARPRGNITGLSTLAPELSGKQLEILKEISPRLARLAVLGTSTQLGNTQSLKETEIAASAFRVQLQYLDVFSARDVESAMLAAAKAQADAVLMLASPVLNSRRKQLAALAVKHRLPVMFFAAEYVDDDGLKSYSPHFSDLFRRVAIYVDKILKGAKPADLPIEQSKKFEFVVNLKAAKQIGLTIPPNVLARADRVIR